LSTADLVAASQALKEAGLAHALKLVHFHVGSQVPDIGTIKRAVREAARFYAKIARMGHELGYLDVGGGLGVDYDGSRTAFDSSTNYSLHEYARDIVYNIMEVCDSEKVAHPAIISESGRAIVAHHSVLIIEAFGAIEKDKAQIAVEPAESDPKLLRDMLEIQKNLTRKTAWSRCTTCSRSRNRRNRCSTSDCSNSRARRRLKRSTGRSRSRPSSSARV
jgi:arginine decarboxylase